MRSPWKWASLHLIDMGVASLILGFLAFVLLPSTQHSNRKDAWEVLLTNCLIVASIGFTVLGISFCAAHARRMKVRKHRIRAGLCLGCGYDLRASTERCPECGRPIIPA